jgi:hypothetical protein
LEVLGKTQKGSCTATRPNSLLGFGLTRLKCDAQSSNPLKRVA